MRLVGGKGSPGRSKAVDCLGYTGSGSPQNLSFGFQPDLFITKRTTNEDGLLFDSVGGNAPFDLSGAAARGSAITGFAFTGTGVTLPANTTGLSTTSGSYYCMGLKKGAINGLDIVTWTGNGSNPRSISHALGATPDFIFARRVDASGPDSTPAWWNGDTVTDMEVPLGGTNNAGAGDATYWTGTVSSSSFQVGSSLNSNGASYIAYIFKSIAGFSKFGTFTGNGSSQAITTSFPVGFLLVKKINPVGTGEREIDFNYQRGFNTALSAGSNTFSGLSDPTGYSVTLGPTSFTLGNSNNQYNASSWDYGYMALAKAA